MTITDLNIEKQHTDARLAELYADREKLSADISALRAKFVRNEVELSDLQAAEQRLAALNGSIGGLETASRELKESIAAQSAQEARKALIDDASAKATAALALLQELTEARAELEQVLSTGGRRIVDLITRLRGAQSEYGAAADLLYPDARGGLHFWSVANAEAFAALQNELRDAGLSPEAFTAATAQTFVFPQTDYWKVFETIELLELNRQRSAAVAAA